MDATIGKLTSPQRQSLVKNHLSSSPQQQQQQQPRPPHHVPSLNTQGPQSRTQGTTLPPIHPPERRARSLSPQPKLAPIRGGEPQDFLTISSSVMMRKSVSWDNCSFGQEPEASRRLSPAPRRPTIRSSEAVEGKQLLLLPAQRKSRCSYAAPRPSVAAPRVSSTAVIVVADDDVAGACTGIQQVRFDATKTARPSQQRPVQDKKGSDGSDPSDDDDNDADSEDEASSMSSTARDFLMVGKTERRRLTAADLQVLRTELYSVGKDDGSGMEDESNPFLRSGLHTLKRGMTFANPKGPNEANELLRDFYSIVSPRQEDRFSDVFKVAEGGWEKGGGGVCLCVCVSVCLCVCVCLCA
jgi:hypothetical protein